MSDMNRITPRTALSTGGVLFAGTMLVAIGIFQVLIGIAAIAEDEVYAPVGDYVFRVDLTGWGWIHLVIGVLLFIVGIGVLTGSRWAIGTAIMLAVISAIGNFLFIPYYPIWSLVIIAFDVLIIWALAGQLGATSPA